MDNPKASATAAAQASYDKTSYMAAAQIATDNLKKPQIVSAMATYNDLAESTVQRVMLDWGTADKPRQRELALQAAYFTHDKIHGKATQRVEQTSTAVTLSLSLHDITGVDDPVTPQEKK